MKKILVLVFVFIFTFCGINAVASNLYSAGVKQFLYYIDNSEGAKATEYIRNFTEKDWASFRKLIDNKSERIPSFYIMVVSDYVFTKDKDKAIEYFYRGRLRAKQDVFMCKDTTARQQINIYPRFAPNTLNYATQRIFEKNDKEYLANVLQKALDWDKSHPKRYDSTWACYHGVRSFYNSGKPELVSEQEQKEIINKERKAVEDAIKELKSGKTDLK